MRWEQLREHAGSTYAAFEELCCLLAAHMPQRADRLRAGWRFDRVGPPDAGKECCWTSPDGCQELWQAKWFAAGLGSSQWTQVDKSVKRAIAEHPGLTRLTVCVNHDRPDPKGTGRNGRRRTTALDRWEKLVETWQALTRRTTGRRLDVIYWGTSELFDQINEPQHVGRRRYFFDREVFTPESVRAHVAAQVKNAGARYTPAAHVQTSAVAHAVELVSLTPAGVAQLRQMAAAVDAAHKAFDRAAKNAELDGETRGAMAAVRASFADLAETLSRPGDTSSVPDVVDATTERFRNAVTRVEVACDAESKRQPGSPLDSLDYAKRQLEAAIDRAVAVIESTAGAASRAKALLLTGRGGAGKTHLACDVAERRAAAGQPTVLLLGQQHDVANFWPQVFVQTGRSFNSRDEFLGALDAAGEVAGCRSLIFFDALNEVRDDPAQWEHELPGLIETLQSYPHVAIVFGVRDTYVEAIVPPSLDRRRLPRIEHVGFRSNTYAAVTTYFGHFNIRLPDTPLLQPEFTNPLFLKLFCIATAGEPDPEHRRPAATVRLGGHGLSVVADAFVEVVESRLVKVMRLDTDADPHPVHSAVRRFAEAMADDGETWLPRDRAADIAAGAMVGRGANAGGPLQQLVSAGVLSRDRHYSSEAGEVTWQEVVRFNYDRFASHWIADVLLRRDLQRDATPPQLRSPGQTLRILTEPEVWTRSANVVEALLVQIPERCGRELFDLVPSAADMPRAAEMYIDSLPWRGDRSFSDGTVAQLSRCMTTPTWDQIDRYFDALLTVAVRPGHRLNADFLHARLAGWAMPDRDVLWTARVPDWYDDDGSAVTRLVDWALQYADHSPADRDVCRLGGIVLAWFCATTVVRLRDRATKGMVALLQDHLSVAAELIRLFRGIDDPYVFERVTAAVYGAAMRSGDKDGLRSLARQVFDDVFADGRPPLNLLTRDSARGVVELAVHRGALSDIDALRVRPPYQSDWTADVPSLAELEPSAEQTRDGRGFRQLWWSATGRHGLGDFGIYVIGTHKWTGWHPRKEPRPKVTGSHDSKSKAADHVAFPSDLPHRYVFHRALQMGWTPERFDVFDSSRSWTGRSRPGVERIGKKYQWIALRELLARVDDEYVRYKHWEGWKEQVEPWDFSYAGRDIDPSVLVDDHPDPDDEEADDLSAESTAAAKSTWCAPIGFTFDVADDGETWLRAADDLPPVEPLLSHVDDDRTEWIVLNRFVKWNRRLGGDGDQVERDAHYILDGYLVRQKDVSSWVAWAEETETYNDVLPRTPSVHRVYWGELWWGAAAQESCDPVKPQWHKPDRGGGRPVLLTSWGYEWESDHKSVFGTVRFGVPDAWLAAQLGVRPARRPGLFVTADGRPTVLDPSGDGSGPPCLLVRRQALEDVLRRHKLALVWTLLGEKNVYHRDEGRDADTGRLIIRGAYRWSPAGAVGRRFSRFRSWGERE